MLGFLIRTVVSAVALWISTLVLDGVSVSGQSALANTVTLLGVAVIFGIVNAVIKPLIQIFGCLFYIITLGLISFIVNALLFMLVGWLAGELNLPFHVDGFWAGFWGAIIVTIASWLINLIIPDRFDKR